MTDSIRFAGDLHPVLVIAGALMAAGVVTWLYLRESRTISAPYSYILPSLRASAVALAILVLAGPVWHRQRTVGTLGRVVFAIDTSESMSRTDSSESSSSPTRIERALRLLTGDSQTAGWLELLSKTHHVEVISFADSEPSAVWSSGDESGIPSAIDLEAKAKRTDLTTGMAATLSSVRNIHIDEKSANSHRDALVLLTDGRDNLGDSPVDLASRLDSSGVSVHAIGIGSQDDPLDISIANVVHPETVAVDGTLAGQLVLQYLGNERTNSSPESSPAVLVRIESGGDVVWKDSVNVSGDTETVIPFELDVDSIVNKIRGDAPRGVRRSTVVMDLSAIVEPVEGDTNASNNTVPFRVAASSRDRRLLILDGSSRWETRYLRNLFERDPAWSVNTVLFGGGTDMPVVKRGDKKGQLPNSRQAMAVYDAIILGEVPPDQFNVTDADLLREFVTRGGGLIVIDGRYQRLKRIARESLNDLIPVEYLDEYAMAVRSIRPSRMGLDHPVLNLWGDKSELGDFWEQVPNPPQAVRVEALPGTEVWAHAVGTDGRESPWLVTRLFGAGRVFYLSTGQTWRWRYKVADRFHARFWNQLLLAVMQPPYSASDDYVALGTDKIEYDEHEQASVRVRLQDNQGIPDGDATVDALLIKEGRILATVPLTVDDPARGTYRGRTPPLEPGAYQVRIRASGFDSNALQATTPIWVGTRDTVEQSRVSLDRNMLMQITDAGKGEYFHESSAQEIINTLKPLSSGRIVETDILVWQSFYWFWAIILLLTIEWWLRKRAGLV